MTSKMRIIYAIDRWDKKFWIIGEWIRIRSHLDSLEEAEAYLKQQLLTDSEREIMENEVNNYGIKIHKVI